MGKILAVFLLLSAISSNLLADTKVCEVGYFTDTENVVVGMGNSQMDGFFSLEYENKLFMVISKEGRTANTLYYAIRDLESGHIAQADLPYPTLSLNDKASNSMSDLMYNNGSDKTYYLTCATPNKSEE